MKPALPAALAPLLIAASITLVYNMPLWQALWDLQPSASGALLIANVGLTLTALLTIVLQLFNTRWLLKPITIVLLLAAALASYAIGNQGVLIDRDMARSILETDATEIQGYVSGAFALHLLLFWLLPSAVLLSIRITRNGTWATFRRALASTAGILGIALVAIAINAKSVLLMAREHRELRYYMVPTYPVYAFSLYFSDRAQQPAGPARQIAPDAHRQRDNVPRRPLVMVLVVGETARSMSFALNGYARATNPALLRQPVVSFTQVSSCGTATAISLPCMFSAHGRSSFDVDDAEHEENVLDLLQRVGVNVRWFDNNSGCKGVCTRIFNARLSSGPGEPPCPATGCFDAVLVHALRSALHGPTQNALHSSTSQHDQLIVLHTRGSHGPDYANRVPPQFKHFLPECRARDVASCPRPQIINAYDNTIVYTDHILATLIADLQAQSERFDSVLLYVSDHGESLGEKGVYLHGFPYRIAPREQTQVPMILWASDGFYARQRVTLACLASRRHQPLSHDSVLHTLLAVFDVQTVLYERRLDLFAACRSGGDPGQHLRRQEG